MIAIIEYNAGNIRSVERACNHIGVDARITHDTKVIENASRIIFPGVGRAGAAMQSLRDNGLDVALKTAFDQGKPILVICIGAQLILDHSEEDDTPCLGLISGRTVRFRPADKQLKVPHIGWNNVRPTQPHPLLEHLGDDDEFYFANSYYPRPNDDSCCYASSHHGESFCAALGRKNLFATQFHPEKSGRVGLKLISAFSRWDGSLQPNAQ